MHKLNKWKRLEELCGYLRIDGEQVAGKTDGVINGDLVEVTMGQEGFNVGLEVISKEDGISSCDEALSECVVVVLET